MQDDIEPQTVQDHFLSKLCREHIHVCIYLMDGSQLYGYIKAFDHGTISIENSTPESIDKRTICAIVPTDLTSFPTS